ncbi:MAG TPA: DUF4191 domain-containing protein [Actinomycetales bacterium]|nr:DUF4191 domain-containing protein [Actinomycetales bacterium]
MARNTSSTSATDPEGAPKRRLFGRRNRPDGKQGRVAQMRAVYQMTKQVDPAIGWWMLLVFAGILVLALGAGFIVGHPIYWTVIGLPLAVLGAMFVLARRAERAAYTQIEGQPGAAGAALRVLRRGWTYEEQPVAVDPRTQDTVFRAVGRPGVVLVGDGPPHRIGKLLEAERRKVARILPGVPLHVVQAGDGEDQVPLRKLGRRITKLKPALTKAEVAEVNKRLRALGGLRPPIPKGIDPFRARPDRRAQRGR